MMKRIYLLFILAICYLPVSIRAEKTVYISADMNNSWADDYCNKNGKNGTISSINDLEDTSERWCKTRSYQTDNIVCFWEAGFGTDPAKMVNPANTSSTFNLATYMNACDSIIRHHVNVMHATWEDGANLNKYKFLFMLSYTTNWIAYGGGYDYVIGAMWLNPAALGVGSTATYPYFVIAHELFHSMSYQCYSDKPNNTYRAFQDAANGPFWERSANFAASQMYPNVNNDLARYMYATHSHFLNTRKHYTTSFFLEHLRDSIGEKALGEIWKQNKSGEHPMVTTSRIFFDNDQAQLNDFVALTAMKNVTWDYPKGTNGYYYKNLTKNLGYNIIGTSNLDEWSIIQKKHRSILYAIDYDKRHFAVRDCQAPQDYGYNAIRIYPDTTAADGSATFRMRFRGHDESDYAKKVSGWRWGFVAVNSNGTPRYGEVYRATDSIVSFTKATDEDEVWLIVTGAPPVHNSYHNYSWEAGFPKYHRYPYEVRFENALPVGFNAEYGDKDNFNYLPYCKRHINGGGYVYPNAQVDSSVYVGPHAKVLRSAKVTGNARIEDFAVVTGAAQVSGNAVIKENAFVGSNAKVYGNAVVSGSARVLNNCSIYDNAFVTDNAFIDETTIYGNAIACGNLWQRDNTCKIGGTCVAGGDCEYIGYIVNGDALSGAEVAGTFLQWPETANNNRTRKDRKGNLSVSMIDSLKNNWNNLPIRYSILNNSISASAAAADPNEDINKSYSYFDTDTEMSMENPSEKLSPVVKRINVYASYGEIHLNGLTENDKIALYQICGQLLFAGTADSETLSIAVGQPGIYLLKIHNQCYKVLVTE